MMTANPNRSPGEPVFSCRLRGSNLLRESSLVHTAHRSTSWNAASAAADWFGTRDLLGCFLWILIRAVEMITVFILRFDQHTLCKRETPSFWLLITFFCFDTFLASYLQLDSVFCNLGESAACVYLLVWFLPFLFVVFCLTFCGYFHCWVVIIFCTRSHIHNHTYTDLPRRCFLSSSVDCDFFLLFCSFFFCCCRSFTCTHFLCLSILFLSNMLLADTLFSSLSRIFAAFIAVALFRCVSISVSSLCHASNYFALTPKLSNRAQICTDSMKTIASAFTGVCVKVIYCV